MLGVLRSLAESRPVVVVVDDIQWLDASSVRVLHFAARRLGTSPVGFVLALRTPPAGAEPLELARALPEGRLVRLAVGPLGAGALGQVVAQRLTMSVPPSLATMLQHVSGGNPFYALELARALDGRAGDLKAGQPLPVPEDLRSLVRGRLRALSTQACDAVLVIAAAHRPDTEMVRAVLGSGGEVGLIEAEAAGVVEADRGCLRLAHPLLGATAYLEARPDKLRRLHACIAEVVIDPVERARHLASATCSPDGQVAEALEAAGRAADARGASGEAAQLAEQAADLTPGPNGDDRRRRAAAAGSYHLRNGDFTRARVLLEEVVADSLPGVARAHALRLLGEVRYNGDSVFEAIPLLRQALDDARCEPGVAGPVELGLAFTLVQSGNLAEGAHHAHAAVAHAEQLDQPGFLAQALAVATMVEFLAGHGLDEARLERALVLEDHQAPTVLWMRPSLIASMLWMWMGRLDEARQSFISLHRRLVERGEEASIPMFCAPATQTECWAGDLAAAKRWSDTSSEAARQSGGDVSHGLALTAQALLYAHVGDADATRSAVAEAVASFQRSGFPMHAMWAMWALGFVELSSGDPAAAHRVLGPLTEAVTASGLGEPASVPFVPDEVEALVELGHLDEAGELLRNFDERGRVLDRGWALASAGRCQGLLLAASGDSEGAERVIDQALIEHKRVAMPIERGRTLLIKGQLLRRRRSKREAKEVLDEAVGVFEAAGAMLWADRARKELARVGLRPGAPLDLTATEAQVAELAATGLTSRAISEQMFLSPKTVEGVFIRIYRKLGVHSRAELATKLAERRAAEGSPDLR